VINQGKDVPEKTIVYFPHIEPKLISDERVNSILQKNTKKREWFTPHFYRCLPLTIGNQYGFSVVSEYDFEFVWDGGHNKESLSIFMGEEFQKEQLHPSVYSHFGQGIITVNLPFSLRTPPGVNLMTINPPNYVIPNITVMTGVVECDNLRRDFTFNLKVQIPGIRVQVTKGTPIAAFIPIPRYFADQFELKNAEDVFDEETINEEINATNDANIHRSTVELELPNQVGRFYFKGTDVYGNEFPDHQKP
jgi:hypothetical protein